MSVERKFKPLNKEHIITAPTDKFSEEGVYEVCRAHPRPIKWVVKVPINCAIIYRVRHISMAERGAERKGTRGDGSTCYHHKCTATIDMDGPSAPDVELLVHEGNNLLWQDAERIPAKVDTRQVLCLPSVPRNECWPCFKRDWTQRLDSGRAVAPT